MDPDTGSVYGTHDVYFSTNFNDVNTGTTPDATVVGPNEYTPPSLLAYYKTYYWRIDSAGASSTYRGDIWQFTVTWDPNNIVDPNLLGWWKFDGDPCDSSGYGRDGTEVGGPTYTLGVDGQAISLDGVDDYVDCGSHPAFDLTDAITITAWIKVNQFDRTWQAIVTRGDNSWRIHRNSNSDYINCAGTGLTPLSATGTTNVDDGAWHHAAGIYDGNAGGLYVYIDGALDGYALVSGQLNISSFPVYIGENAQATGRFWNGLIDDVRIYDYAISEAKLWEIVRMDPAKAYNPRPRRGETGVERSPTLSWSPGDYAPATNGHIVNFGTAPGSLVQISGPQTPNDLDLSTIYPAGLDLGKTYYWQVNEVNGLAPGGIDAGNIWHFTVIEYAVVDNMNTYTVWGIADNNIFDTWKDGWTNGTGAEVLLETDTTITHDGNSMYYHFTDSCSTWGPYYSEAKATVSTLPSGIGSDWTIGGAKILTLYFRGNAGNSIDPMWVQLSDGSNSAKITYGDGIGENPNDINDPSWHEWNIALQDFNDKGVNVANVIDISIGFGDGTVRGIGYVLIDDIVLEPPVCILSRRSVGFQELDYVEDCVIDAGELRIMGRDWLLYDYTVYPVAPNEANLVGWWKFEGDANDSSGKGNDGTLMPDPNGYYSTFEPGKVGQAIKIWGTGDWVELPTGLIGSDIGSVCMWIKTTQTTRGMIFYGSDGTSGNGYGGENELHVNVENGGGIDFYIDGDPTSTEIGTSPVNDDVWYHIVATWDITGEAKLYVDGGAPVTATHTGNNFILSARTRLGRPNASERYYSGLLDDVRVYDYVLSPEEIAYVVGLGPVYVELDSPANVYDAEPTHSKFVNFKDFAKVGAKWLVEELWPQ
jgi:hypothetical protein